MSIELVLLGCFYYSLLNFCTQNLLKRYTTAYISVADRYVITEKCVNGMHGVVSACAGYLIVSTCSDIMVDSHWLTNRYTCFGAPYFLYDIVAIYNTHYYLNQSCMEELTFHSRIKHFVMRNIPMLCHHIALPAIYLPMILYLRNNKGDYFVGIFFMIEAALPFIAVRFILAQLKLKHTKAYLVFGLMMVAVFFVTRILVFPFLYWKYSQYSSMAFTDVPFKIPIKCNVGCLIILVAQMYFMWLMIRGTFRVFYKIYIAQKSKNG